MEVVVKQTGAGPHQSTVVSSGSAGFPLSRLCLLCLILLCSLLSPPLFASSQLSQQSTEPPAGTDTAPPVISLAGKPDQPLGKQASWRLLKEPSEPWSGALADYRQGLFSQGHRPVLSFGIGTEPIWIAATVENSDSAVIRRTLLIDNAWIDSLEIRVRHRSSNQSQLFRGGDTQSWSERPSPSRVFQFEVSFEPGRSDILIRVETADPLVVPIYLLTESQLQHRTLEAGYYYGFAWGFLLALLAYNAILFLGLRDPRHLCYALYLGLFCLMNLSYTGHGFMWLWPQLPGWQNWGQPTLMILFSAAGLLFATVFLDTRHHCRQVHHLIVFATVLAASQLLLAFLADNQALALFTSFSFMLVYAGLMLAAGIFSHRRGHPIARYFLLAVLAGTTGVAVTAAATWGFIPFSDWSFRAADIGMLIEATLLALALSWRIRIVDRERTAAEKLASTDALTQLDNRRAFYQKARMAWSAARRHHRRLSIIMIDLDNFKQLNDTWGHAFGDEVLISTGRLLASAIRKEDTAARWGGEEFILLLPDADLDAAGTFARRLNREVNALELRTDGHIFRPAASFGVAEMSSDDSSVEDLIHRADKALYRAKDNGRNQVAVCC